MALLAANENIFTDEEVRMAIAPVGTFDPDYLDYYNFLEAIVRVAKARPWTEEEQAELPQFDAKLDKICDLLQQTYQEEYFDAYRLAEEQFEQDRKYMPRLVMEDEEGLSEEEDDLDMGK